MSLKKMIYLSLIFITVIKSQIPDTEIPDMAFITQFLLTPDDFQCDVNHTMICDATGLACNPDIGLCFPPCEADTDCSDFGDGTGLNKCVDGACTTDGTCAVSEDECAISLGFTCNTVTNKCEQPTGCKTNNECDTPGLGYCDTTLGTGICRPELCQASDDCISAGYVCQNPPGLCIESCKTNDICAVENPGSAVTSLTCGDSGLCELIGCTQDIDCTDFTNTCLDGPGPRICVTTCTTAYDCEDLGIPGAICQEGFCMVEPPMDVVRCSNDTDCSDAGLNATCVDTPAGIAFCVPSCQNSLDCPDLYLTTTTCQDGFCIPEAPFMPTSCTTGTDCEGNDECVSEVGYCLPSCDTDADCVQSQFTCDVDKGYCYPGCTNDGDCSDIPATVCAESGLDYKTCIIDNIIPKSCQNNDDCGSGYCIAKLCYPSCNVDQDCIDLGLKNPCKSQSYGFGFAKVTIKYCDITQDLPDTPTSTAESTTDHVVVYTTESVDTDDAVMHVIFGAFVSVIMVIFKVW